MKASVRHHYIPRFYLKGFTNERNSYFVYDKRNEVFFKSSPENTFFENHRNTGNIINQQTGESETSDLPETMLSYFDGKIAGPLATIRNSQLGDDVLTADVLYEIMMLMHSIFWRSPANDALREELIRNASFKELGFGIFDNQGKRSPDLEAVMKSVDLFTKTYSSLLPVSAFVGKNYTANYEDWRLYYASNDFHIVTDNPVIYKNVAGFSTLHHDVIFPLSSRILLVASKKFIKQFDWKMLFMIDLYLFANAQRFIACKDEAYLNELVKRHEDTVNQGGLSQLKNTIFSMFG